MKKNLVKLMACVLATVSLGSLVSCGDEVQAVDTVEINVWATEKEEAVIKKVVGQWNAEHPANEQFNIKFTAIAEGDAGTQLAKDPTVEGAPALFLCADDHINELRSKSIIAEIKGERREKIEKNNSDVAVLGVTQDEKVWGYPVTSDNGYFLWYNKGVAGVQDKIGSLEDLLAFAEANKKTVLMDVGNGWYANSFIMSPQACGVESLKWVNDANNNVVYETSWDDATGVKVSEYIGGLLAPYYEKGVLVSGSNAEITDGFKNGSMIAAVSGTWMEGDLVAAVGEANLGADKLPEYHIDGKAYQMASFGGSKVYCINKTRPAAEQLTAATLAELLNTAEAQLIRFEERGCLPCNKEAAKDKRYTENVSIGGAAFLKQSAYACVQAKTAEGRYWDIGLAIGSAYINGLTEGVTWTQFLKQQMDILRTPVA